MKYLRLMALLLLGGAAGLHSAHGQPIDYTKLVNPFVGTGEHGHTYPGALVPFGMVQLSPDTRMVNWDGSSGYHYADRTILGFSHTHLSGTGEPELCDILLMPTTGAVELQSGVGDKEGRGYLSPFSHQNESAEPGYYRVHLDKYQIGAELTATERTGFHRYTFPASAQANVIIDLKHRGKIVQSALQLVNDSTITGFTVTTGWAEQKHIYFYARFSKRFKSSGIAVNDSVVKGVTRAEGKNIKGWVSFSTADQEQVLVKVGISSVSEEGARKNLEAENCGWDFAGIRQLAKVKWNRYLSKIEAEGGSPEQRRVFYTALYHTAAAPNLFMDVDSFYFGQDHKVHKAQGFTNYSVFSLWDVFRAQMPLFTITEPSRMRDFMRSFMAMYRVGGRIPRFEILGTLSDNMIGYHSLPIILDAYQKGIRDFDIELAFKGMKAVSEVAYFNDLGFIPGDLEGMGGTVARTMEHCYNAWCVAELARLLNHREDQLLYERRAQFYKNLFDAQTGFMRPKNSDYSWVTPFDPAEPSGYYVEGNAYQYTAFVPHDINTLIRLQGGDHRFVQWLDTLFTHKSKYDKNVVDASGLIGQYAHGNEPSHQIAYLYNYAGAAPKTQALVRKILSSLYSDTPEGISGNEDCGQMSAWYVMSAMGFYSVLPGHPSYAIGSPTFDKVTIHLENGKTFTIRADGASDQNPYIESAQLNGKSYSRSWFTHDTILQGGELKLVMGNRPNPQWGTSPQDRPFTRPLVSAVMTPYFKMQENYFFEQATIELGSQTAGTTIYYTLDGSTPTEKSTLYSKPIVLHQTTQLKFFAKKTGLLASTVVSATVTKLEKVESVFCKDFSHLNLKPGLNYRYYEVHVMHVEELDPLIPKKSGITPYFSLEERDNDGLFAFTYDGFIRIPKDGVYTFFLSTNDGGVLYLDGQRFIDADGPRTASASSRMAALKAGTYRIGEKYFQMGGAFSNTVSWKGPGMLKQVIPPSVLFHE